MKSIAFLLPSIPAYPQGGFRVVFQYANMFANDGYDVQIVYPTFMPVQTDSACRTILRFFKAIFRFLFCKFGKDYSYKKWYELDSRVQECFTFTLNEIFVPKSDVYIATSIRTAFYLNKYSTDSDKLYFIQGFEAWGGITEEQVISTFKFGFKNIVISKWLQKCVSQYAAKCVYIPNGFDFDTFKKYIDQQDRERYRITMLYHTQDLKGCDDAFQALNIVKERFKELKVNIFGVPARPKNLPDWYEYYQQPDKEVINKLYNEASIFIGTSWNEGWGLTVGEAMICGCAIACTDIDGYKEMVENGVTALLSPIKDPKSLADNIIKLIEDDEYRKEMSIRGNNHIMNFKWESSYEKLKNIIR